MLAKLLRPDLVTRSYSREGKTLSYSQINTVAESEKWESKKKGIDQELIQSNPTKRERSTLTKFAVRKRKWELLTSFFSLLSSYFSHRTSLFSLIVICITVKPVLKSHCIKGSPVLSSHFYGVP